MHAASERDRPDVALAAKALELVLVNGTTYYVALGTDADELAGTLTELTTDGYSRKAHSAWMTVVTSTATERRNNGAILFDAVSVSVEGIAWWAIYDASPGGNLLAIGRVLNSLGVVEPAALGAGDQLRLNDQDLRIRALQGAA